MNDIEYKVQTLVEKRDFEKLTPAEKEMVYSVMSEEEYIERRELLKQSEALFASEEKKIVPDVAILLDLKQKIKKSENEVESHKALPFAFLTYKISLVKSAAAALLLLLGSYFVFSNSESEVKYIEKEVLIEKKIYDTVYTERIVEVPVEKIVKVVEYKEILQKKNLKSPNVSFAMKELESNPETKTIELKDLKNSYGNTKIDEKDLEQFRVSL